MRAAKNVPPRGATKGTSRRASPSCEAGTVATALTEGSCESVRAICCTAHLPLDGPRRTRKSEPTTACSTVDGLARRALAPEPAGSFRFVMTTGTPALAGSYSPISIYRLPQGVHRQRKVGAGQRPLRKNTCGGASGLMRWETDPREPRPRRGPYLPRRILLLRRHRWDGDTHIYETFFEVSVLERTPRREKRSAPPFVHYESPRSWIGPVAVLHYCPGMK